jgi:hypothetical protein
VKNIVRHKIAEKCLVGIILIWWLSFFQVQPAFAGRPLDTEDAPTVEKGKFSIEIGNDWLRNPDRSKSSILGGVILFGLTDNIELNILKSTGSIVLEDISKLPCTGNSLILLKYRFKEQSGYCPSLGVDLFTNLNDGSETVAPGSTEYGAVFFATREFKDFILHANLGYTSAKCKLFGKENIINYSAAFEKPLDKRWTLVGEVVGKSSRASMDEANALIGLTYKVSPGIILDVAYSRGLNEYTYRSRTTVGATINF